MNNLHQRKTCHFFPRFDHVELVTTDPGALCCFFQKMSFSKEEKVGTPILKQGSIQIVLVNPLTNKSELNQSFMRNHGGGISVVGFEVADCFKAFEVATKRGARVASVPRVIQTTHHRAIMCEIWSPGDLRFRLVSREVGEFSPHSLEQDAWLAAPSLIDCFKADLFEIDHFANLIPQGDLDKWLVFYERIFGFEKTEIFEVKTRNSGFRTAVAKSSNSKIKIPLLEPLNQSGQIQDFLDKFNGSGVQHLALRASSIIDLVRKLKKERLKFLNHPKGYYQNLVKIHPNEASFISELEKLSILLERKPDGNLLQVFSEPIVGPFFIELIQRDSQNGFGEGNIKALAEAVDQATLKNQESLDRKVA